MAKNSVLRYGKCFFKGTSKYSACGRSREDFSSDKTKFRARSELYAKGFCEIWRKRFRRDFVRWIFRGALNYITRFSKCQYLQKQSRVHPQKTCQTKLSGWSIVPILRSLRSLKTRFFSYRRYEHETYPQSFQQKEKPMPRFVLIRTFTNFGSVVFSADFCYNGFSKKPPSEREVARVAWRKEPAWL